VRFSTAELALHLGGTLVGADVTVDGASIDSRSLRSGQLFVPIVAERDGHDYIPEAIAAGAPAYLTAQPPEPDATTATAIVVDETSSALLALGALARTHLGGGVVGITGSVGKTTTKDLLADCLSSTFSTAASARSFNNELGLPLTLLDAPDDARWAVLEMGARGVGHITRLAEVARPDVGIVTSVAMAHVEFFGDLDGVARAKSELVAALPATGVAVLNLDDIRVGGMASASPCPVLGYAVEGDADVRARDISLDDDLRPRFRLLTPWGEGDVRLTLHGAHQVGNALAAAAAALWCGVRFDDVVASLGRATGSPLRMEVLRPAGRPVLVVDCYNANPASTEAALRSLGELPGRRKLALLGLMAELGEETVSEHRRMAAVAAELGIEVVGFETDLYGDRRASGVDAAVSLLGSLGADDAVLIKGSRVAHLEDVARAVDGSVE
jgi:UDP-N-acetylmuramoyl-tripeptide--D-alanyl-D-alanine ligase